MNFLKLAGIACFAILVGCQNNQPPSSTPTPEEQAQIEEQDRQVHEAESNREEPK